VAQLFGLAILSSPFPDKEGIAIIICEATLQSKYQELLEGKTILESNLHLNLIEHLASEINLGTITNIETAKHWLRNSFLFQRLQVDTPTQALSSYPLIETPSHNRKTPRSTLPSSRKAMNKTGEIAWMRS
jgi:hypothetical protein